MFKNKTLDIKIILETLKTCYKYFKFPNKLLFYKASKFLKLVIKNYFLELFLK